MSRVKGKNLGLEIKLDGYQHIDAIRSHGTKCVIQGMKVGEKKKKSESTLWGSLICRDKKEEKDTESETGKWWPVKSA